MKLIRFAMPVIALFAIAATAAADTVRYLMTVEGVTTSPFPVQSLSWGLSNPVYFGAGGGTTGKVSISSFNIMKAFDGNSAAFANACANGISFDNARVRAFRGTSTTPFMDIYFTNVFVESQQWSASTNQMPFESVSFAFETVTLNGTLLSPVVLSNPQALNQLLASLVKQPSKPALKQKSKVTVR